MLQVVISKRKIVHNSGHCTELFIRVIDTSRYIYTTLLSRTSLQHNFHQPSDISTTVLLWLIFKKMRGLMALFLATSVSFATPLVPKDRVCQAICYPVETACPSPSVSIYVYPWIVFTKVSSDMDSVSCERRWMLDLLLRNYCPSRNLSSYMLHQQTNMSCTFGMLHRSCPQIMYSNTQNS